MTFGTPEGDQQPQALVQVFLNMAVFGMDIQKAIEAPRFRARKTGPRGIDSRACLSDHGIDSGLPTTKGVQRTAMLFFATQILEILAVSPFTLVIPGSFSRYLMSFRLNSR